MLSLLLSSADPQLQHDSSCHQLFTADSNATILMQLLVQETMSAAVTGSNGLHNVSNWLVGIRSRSRESALLSPPVWQHCLASTANDLLLSYSIDDLRVQPDTYFQTVNTIAAGKLKPNAGQSQHLIEITASQTTISSIQSVRLHDSVLSMLPCKLNLN